MFVDRVTLNSELCVFVRDCVELNQCKSIWSALNLIP